MINGIKLVKYPIKLYFLLKYPKASWPTVGGTGLHIKKSFKDSQSPNAFFPRVFKELPIVTVSRVLQFANAFSLISVTEFGINTLLRFLQA